jgi:hypothetical protein
MSYNNLVMEEPLIRDIPSIKKSLEDLRNFKAFKKARWLWRPIFKLLGADVKQIDEGMFKVDELEVMIQELAMIPDRFNDLFAGKGWIIYDSMNVEVAKEAIKKAESGDIDGAEADLVNYYAPDKIEWNLQTMMAVNAFRPRMRLARLALVDYREERYHACIPVILSLLDGLVNELQERRRGFFAEEVNLEAWDSIAAHSKGLNVLAGIFQKGRYKTTTEQITIPYRNGILHGMDLGYDNKVVAAKTWAALFATREWALKAEQGLLVAPPSKPETTWGEILEQLRENADDKARLDSWKPRTIEVGQSVPTSGNPDAFESGTPEHKLAEFLSYWEARNYGYMARCLSSNLGYSDRKLPAIIREHYSSKRLKAFEFKGIKDNAPAITEIEADLVYEEEDTAIEKTMMFRLINEDDKGNPAVGGKPGTSWVVYTWFV